MRKKKRIRIITNELAVIQLSSSLALALHPPQESLTRLPALSVMLSCCLCLGACPVMIYIYPADACSGNREADHRRPAERLAEAQRGAGCRPQLSAAPCLHAQLWGSGGDAGVLDKV